MRMRAAQIGAFALVFAAALTTAAAQSPLPSSGTPPPPPNLALPPRGILGTLDPATGQFTPDGAATAGRVFDRAVDLVGTLDLRLDLSLDPELTNHPRSVYCTATVSFSFNAFDRLGPAGADRTGQLALTQKGSSATGTLSIPFWLVALKQAVFEATITASCAAFGQPAEVVATTFIRLDGGGQQVSLQGSI